MSHLIHVFRFQCLVSALLVFGNIPVFAQENGTPLTARLLCFERVGELGELRAGGTKDGETVSCPLPRGNPSDPIDLMVTGGKVAFRNLDLSAVVATASIPPGTKQALLVFVPSAAAEYKIMVIDEAPESFPPGGAVVCNLHNSDVRFIVGEHRFQVPPGKKVPMKRPEQRDDFNMAPLEFFYQQGAEWKSVSETRLRFTAEARYLILSYMDPQSKRPRMKTYRDVPLMKLPPTD